MKAVAMLSEGLPPSSLPFSLFLYCFETGSHVAQDALELNMQPRMSLNS